MSVARKSADPETPLDILQRVYGYEAFRGLQGDVIENAMAGLPVPLHPGAARYYKEVGLNVPDRLMAK